MMPDHLQTYFSPGMNFVRHVCKSFIVHLLNIFAVSHTNHALARLQLMLLRILVVRDPSTEHQHKKHVHAPCLQLVLLFPYAFWDPSIDMIAHVSPDPQDAGLYFLFYAYTDKLAGNGAVLAALVSGKPTR
jgi:hypothetical protein